MAAITGDDERHLRAVGAGERRPFQWPGAPLGLDETAVQGLTNMEIDASRMMWVFFVQHPLPME